MKPGYYKTQQTLIDWVNSCTTIEQLHNIQDFAKRMGHTRIVFSENLGYRKHITLETTPCQVAISKKYKDIMSRLKPLGL